jgi:hypothetical protein
MSTILLVGILLAAASIMLLVFRNRGLVCTVARTVVVCGDVAAVFAYLADFSNAEEWDPNVKDARWLTNPQPQPTVGDAFELTTLFQKRASITKYVLTGADRTAAVLTLRGESDTALLDDHITLHDDSQDGVKRTRVEYQLIVRLKGRLAPCTFLVTPALEALATESIDGLVTTCAKKFGSGVRSLKVPDNGTGLPLGGQEVRNRKPPPLTH